MGGGRAVAVDWRVRPRYPADPEGAAAVRRTRPAAARVRGPGVRLPVLRPGTTGAGPAGRLAAPSRHAAGPDPDRLRTGTGPGRRGGRRLLVPGRGRYRE